MTIPSRPAPAPPGPCGLNAAAGANASLEQLRLQLQQQQQTQQQNGGVQKLTIKLPPPPSSRSGTPFGNVLQQQKSNNYNHNNNNSHNISNNSNATSSSITRKFPQANVRYAPATSWDGLPFEPTATTTTTMSSATMNGNFKKVPPPRPPPPKVQVGNGKRANAPAVPAQQSINILNNIFQRKKSTKAPVPSAREQQNKSGGRLTPAGVYGTSSGTFAVPFSSPQISNSSNTNSGNANLNSWGTYSSSSSSFYSHHTTITSSSTSQDQQLISFDSPPSSPTFTQKSNSDCVSVDSFSSDSNFSSPQNGSVSQPESGFEDDFTARSSCSAASPPVDPWEATNMDAFSSSDCNIGTAPVRNLSAINTRIQSSHDNPLCNGKSLLPPAPSLAKPTIIKPKISQKPKAPKPPVLGGNYGNFYTATVLNSNQPSTPPSPPMPMCAPPPPPATTGGVTLLDVISGKADALQLDRASSEYGIEESGPSFGIALYDFEGLEDGDLMFKENDKIYLLEQVSEEWFRGRTRNGCEGIFPVNYIDIRIPLKAAAAETATAHTTASNFTMQATHLPQQTALSYKTPKVKCLYTFPAEVDGDLALKENDAVTILYKVNEDWLYGEVNGRQGQFPSNFLEYVPENIPMP